MLFPDISPVPEYIAISTSFPCTGKPSLAKGESLNKAWSSCTRGCLCAPATVAEQVGQMDLFHSPAPAPAGSGTSPLIACRGARVVRPAPRTHTCGMEGKKAELGRGRSWALMLYQFSAAAITHYHKLKCLKTIRISYLALPEFRGLKTGCVPSGGSRKNVFPCLFQFLGVSSFLGPWLLSSFTLASASIVPSSL